MEQFKTSRSLSIWRKQKTANRASQTKRSKQWRRFCATTWIFTTSPRPSSFKSLNISAFRLEIVQSCKFNRSSNCPKLFFNINLFILANSYIINDRTMHHNISDKNYILFLLKNLINYLKVCLCFRCRTNFILTVKCNNFGFEKIDHIDRTFYGFFCDQGGKIEIHSLLETCGRSLVGISSISSSVRVQCSK